MRQRITKTLISGLVATLIVLGSCAGAHAAGPQITTANDSHFVRKDLQGTVLVAGGEVYSGDLKPVATVDEYTREYAAVGVWIAKTDADATKVKDGLAPQQTLGDDARLGRLGTSVAGPMKADVVGCSGHDENRSLQRFQRAAKGGAARGIADLRCGLAAKWGWRHIGAGHSGDYGRVAALMGKSWDSYAKWCLGQTLGMPSSAYYQANNKTYLYNTPIQVWKNGRLYRTYTNHVSVSRGDFRVITEYFD